jgi:hypothetical protein
VLELGKILRYSNISEFIFKILGSDRKRFGAIKIINFANDKALLGLLRLDVLIWDVKDSRHKIKNRDDIANLHVMFFNLFKRPIDSAQQIM